MSEALGSLEAPQLTAVDVREWRSGSSSEPDVRRNVPL